MPLSTIVSCLAVLFGSVLVAGCKSLDASASRSGAVLAALPSEPHRDSRYAIYLHGVVLDRMPEPAAVERFTRITHTLAAHGLVVIAEIRGPDTIRKSPEDLDRYARKVAAQVNALLQAGVPAHRISVVGYSRGGVIAQMTAGYVGRRDVGYAVLAGCVSERGAVKSFVPVLMRYAEKLAGRFLSVIEESDADFGSCAPYLAKAGNAVMVEETVLSTGKGHLLFSEPDDRWLAPLTTWLSNDRGAGW